MPRVASSRGNNKACGECTAVLTSDAKFVQHYLQKHPGVPPFKCSYPDCTATANQRSNMDSHVKKVHERTRLPVFTCTEPGCGKTTTEKRHMDTHMAIHVEKAKRAKFKCPHPGCLQEFLNECSVAAHLRDLHPVVAEVFSCKATGCCFTTTAARYLATHEEMHAENRRTFHCDHAGCTATFYHKLSLVVHQKNHARPHDKEFKCTECPSDRVFQTNRRAKLHSHLNEVHNNARPHACSVEGCTETFKRPAHLREHVDRSHVDMERLGFDSGDSTDHYRDAFDQNDDGELQLPRGVEHVILAMVKQDFPQLTKQYKIDCRCLYDGAEGNEKHRREVRVDASIVFSGIKLHVFFEVDENQHKNSPDTTPIKELRRMQDATDALRETQGEDEEERVLWVRFNPSGSFRAGSSSSSPPLAQRVTMLRDFLLEYEPSHDKDEVQVAYMFYDNDAEEWIRVVELPLT